MARRQASSNRWARLASVLISVGIATVVPSSPAAADPPGPTDYRTEVQSIEPATDAFEIEIIGGDSFVLLRQTRPVQIDVVGYNGEPYLRFNRDGTVDQNRRSPAVYLNEDRYGDGSEELPPQADAAAPPEWEEVADDGTYAWHDHRAHWMLESRPFASGPGDQILEAVIPTRVDGIEIDVQVASFWVSGPSSLPYVAGGAMGIALGLVAWRRPSGAPAITALAAGTALVVGVGQFRSVPAETEPSTTLWILPAVAVVAALAALAFRRQPATALPLTIGAAVSLIVFGALRLPESTRAILPTDVPFWLDRGLSTSVTLAALACLAVVGLEFSRLMSRGPSGDQPTP